MPASQTMRSVGVHLAVGLGLFFILFGAIGGWAATTPLSGAVIVRGTLVVENYPKPVQHAQGGVVTEILVRNGDTVEAGQLLVRLRDTEQRTNFEIIERRYLELLARKARLEAERTSAHAIDFSDELLHLKDAALAAEIMDTEREVLNAHWKALTGQEAQIAERLDQLDEQIAGLRQQLEALQTQEHYLSEDLESSLSLQQKGLTTRVRVNELQRNAASLKGEIGSINASIASAKAQRSETSLQRLQLQADMQREASAALSDTSAEIGQALAQKIAAADSLSRQQILAPHGGYVHELTVRSPGAVIGAGEKIMSIVPNDEALLAEVRIAPQDIDQVEVGQRAQVNLSAFDANTTPKIEGIVKRVSADVSYDAQTGVSSYRAGIQFPREELSKLGDIALVPGMPIEAFLNTGSRTALSYLLKPLSDQAEHAFRQN